MLKNVILKYKSLHLPPHILAIRIFNQFIYKAKKGKQIKQLKNGDYINPTKNIKLKNGPFYQKEINISELKNELIDYLNSQYLNHFFDYLGSGWVNLNKNGVSQNPQLVLLSPCLMKFPLIINLLIGKGILKTILHLMFLKLFWRLKFPKELM